MENKKTRRIGTRLAVFGCALALVTMAGVGMTFAKYTKSAGTTETGTVAAFGTTLTQSGDIFTSTYTGTTFETNNNITVKDKDTATQGLTLAPGTDNGDGKVFSYTISGNEVAVAVTFSITSAITNWDVDGVTYEPVVFTITKKVDTNNPQYLSFVAGNSQATPATVDHLEWTSNQSTLTLTQLSSIKASDADFTETTNYAPQTSTTVTYTTTWEWAFTQSGTPTANAAYVCKTAFTTTASKTYQIGDVINPTTYSGLTTTEKDNFTPATSYDDYDTELGNQGDATITYASELTATQIN